MPFTLFQLEDCHLCEEAAALAHAAGVTFTAADIGDDDDLDARYGVRIPVLRHEPSGNELDWPFDAGRLSDFLAALPNV